MLQERLNGLALMVIVRDLLNKVNIEIVVDVFVTKYARRASLLSKFVGIYFLFTIYFDSSVCLENCYLY